MAPLTIAVLGATGFVGRHLLRALANRPDTTVRALVHRRPLPPAPNVLPVPGNALDPASLRSLVVPGAVVVNLAWSDVPGDADWQAGMRSLAAVCGEREAARLVHCSSISVYGASPASRVDEETPLVPRTPYERSKATIELMLKEECRGRVPLVTVRPTSVFGTDGRSLVRLAGSLCIRFRPAAFLRSCLFDRRRVHLTSVETVVAALLFLATKPMTSDAETFVLSEDDDPLNEFRAVERRLMAALGVPDYGVPRVTLPPALLSLLLRAQRRSDVVPHRVYDGSRLLAAGFTRPWTLGPALDAFGRRHRDERAGAGAPAPEAAR